MHKQFLIHMVLQYFQFFSLDLVGDQCMMSIKYMRNFKVAQWPQVWPLNSSTTQQQLPPPRPRRTSYRACLGLKEIVDVVSMETVGAAAASLLLQRVNAWTSEDKPKVAAQPRNRDKVAIKYKIWAFIFSKLLKITSLVNDKFVAIV